MGRLQPSGTHGPEVGLWNLLWASDFRGLHSSWLHAKAMGYAPAEAALGKEALHRLVFDNVARLYKIPVTLPPKRARNAQLASGQGTAKTMTKGPEGGVSISSASLLVPRV
jgi:hypothetical protein